jgi:electron transport complex protein RnfC
VKIMSTLILKSDEKKIQEAPEPKEVLIPLIGFDKDKNKLKVREGAQIVTGEELFGDNYSTVTGTVKGVQAISITDTDLTAVRIQVSDADEFDPVLTEEPNYLEKESSEILEKLNRANLGFCTQLDDIQTVIISAVDREPLATVSQQILRENKDFIGEAAQLLKHITSAKKVVLAVPENLQNMASNIPKDQVEIYSIKPVYPNGLPELIVRDISQKIDIGKSIFLRIEKLIASLSALKEGKPQVHKVVNIIGKGVDKTVKVRIGTLVKDLLEEIQLENNDKVIIGGPMMGYACYDTEIPITDDVDMVYVQAAGEFITSENNQCMNCGHCVNVCPVNLNVNLISRYAEFSIFDKCEELGAQLCIDCGLCAYYCPSGRSLVQFLGLAKKEIEKLEKEEEE